LISAPNSAKRVYDTSSEPLSVFKKLTFKERKTRKKEVEKESKKGKT